MVPQEQLPRYHAPHAENYGHETRDLGWVADEAPCGGGAWRDTRLGTVARTVDAWDS